MALRLPPKYVFASVLVALGGFSNGYDTGSIGALLSMAQFSQSIGPLSPFLLGFTVALMMLAGVLPSLIAGHMADRSGRLRIILLGAALFAVGSLLQGMAPRLALFMAGRALAGAGQGIFLGPMSVYICEIAPFRFRGALAGLPQFFAVTGTCAGYFTCYATVAIPSSIAWRLPLLAQCVFASCLVISCLTLPESPRWLILHGRRTEARRSLQRLQFPLDEVESSFTATEHFSNLSPWQSFVLLFSRAYRPRTVLGLFVLGMVQLSGIDGVLYYAPTLFAQAGLSSSTASFLASGVSAILMLAVSIPAFLLADRWGRRTSAITGGLVLATCMLLIGGLYAAGVVHQTGAARWVVITAVYVFGLAYSVSWAIMSKIYASEIQPAHVRASANCVAQALAFFTNWLVAIITPIILDKSPFGVYFLFGGLALGTVAFLAAYMPETRGRSLEEIQVAFQQPSLQLRDLKRYVRELVTLRARSNN
ncbi:general substrate transporter [Aspergillus aculeatinus CBS 121060]|uniref:General substrate transporter n=1 Tax=Aspergillus aculeatinus CBS 121060 TaxID=1448322 RepID=A0ACD1H6S3_9EURO|nr:general substrate transporter [Aspergillus aculeatinus CBS 121060]RAH69112.1 general substrate transporter [Aspergillus aculeatinus CBS 121060]